MLVNNELFLDVAKSGIPKMNPKTNEYREWWKEQKRRCTDGITIGGRYMPGKLYGYVNFGTIELFDEGSGRKVKGKPLLRDVEWEVFNEYDQAVKNHQGFMWISGRRGGKSYILAWILADEYTFYPDNELVLSAFTSSYSDKTMTLIKTHLDGLYGTPFYHQRIKDNIESELRSGYELKDERGIWVRKGFNSRIHNITFKQTHTAANGKSTKVFGYEEIGMFDNLIACYNSSEPCWKEGSHWFGTPFMIGTGGDMEKGSVDAQKIFYDPKTYNLRQFIDGETSTPRAYFLPAQYVLNDFKFLGEDGITLVTDFKAATKKLDDTREEKKNGKQKDAYFKELQYYPKTPDEAFIQSTGNVFPQDLLQEQLNHLLSNKAARDLGQNIRLELGDRGQIIQKPDHEAQEADFPFSVNGNNKGCIVIYEPPRKGDIPFGLYIAGLDPYRQDEATTSDSLGSCIIYKRMVSVHETYDWPVAEYTGRPDSSDEYYENCRRLLIYYNARCLYENEVPGFKQYLDKSNCLKYLAPQPQIIKDIVKDSVVHRDYGIHMPDKIKAFAELKLRDWLITEVGDKGSGKYNTSKIYSINLIKELINYNRKGNFDRVIAFMLCILHDMEMHKVSVEDMDEQSIAKDSQFKDLFALDGWTQTRGEY